MTAWRAPSVLAFVALAQSGCFLFGTPSDDPPPVEAPLAGLGTKTTWAVDVAPGHDTWVAVPENAEVEKIHGGQGGYHVWTSIHVDPGADTLRLLEMEVTVTSVATGAVVSRSSSMMNATVAADGGVVAEGLRAYVDADTTGPVLVHVKVADTPSTFGAPPPRRWAEGEKRVVVR